MEKKVVFHIKSSPYQTLNNYEALRASISCFEHKVCVLWMEDGVYLPLKRSDKKLTQPFIRLSEDMGVTLHVNETDLVDRGLNKDDLVPEAKPIDRNKALEMLLDADFVITL